MNKHIKQTRSTALVRALSGGFICLLLSHEVTATLDVDAVEQGMVRVVTYTPEGDVIGTGSGFVINDSGVVITNHHVVADGRHFGIYASGSNTELTAQIVNLDEQHDLAILRVPGLRAKVISLSSAEIKNTDRVWSVGFPGLADRLGTAFSASWSDGAVSRVFPGSWGGPGSFKIIQHTAEINPGNSGGPLLDDCRRVIGVNTQGSGTGRIARDASGEITDIVAGTGIFFASHIEATMQLLRSADIDFTATSEPCVFTPAAAAAEPLSLLKNNKVWAAALLILSLLLTFLAWRKPRQHLVRIVAQSTRTAAETVGIKTGNPAPGIVLSGFDAEGKPLRVIISGKRIGEGRGATLGRHPALTVATIEDQSVSRRQFRFSYADQSHYIEDLNSSNGTKVNKVRLKPFVKTPVNPGDTITAGKLEFTLSRSQ